MIIRLFKKLRWACVMLISKCIGWPMKKHNIPKDRDGDRMVFFNTTFDGLLAVFDKSCYDPKLCADIDRSCDGTVFSTHEKVKCAPNVNRGSVVQLGFSLTDLLVLLVPNPGCGGVCLKGDSCSCCPDNDWLPLVDAEETVFDFVCFKGGLSRLNLLPSIIYVEDAVSKNIIAAFQSSRNDLAKINVEIKKEMFM